MYVPRPFTLRSLRPISSAAILSGLFSMTVAMLAAAAPCEVPNTGGTVVLPPANCGYLSPDDLHMIIDGLPPGTTIEVGLEHQEFFNITSGPGGGLGGEFEQFQSFAFIDLNGTGSLAGYQRPLSIQVQCETHIGPRILGDPVQSFDTEMFLLQGQITGDPDFDLLRITAGSGFGLPSPGHTTLTQLPSGDFNVDSFFDITYRIDFVGAPGGALGGMSGSTTGTIRMATGEPAAPPPCTVVDNGTGTVDLPPDGCGYVSPADLHMMIDGLPPGTEIHVAAEHDRFFNVSHVPGGPLGGEVEQFQSFLELELSGTGDLTGFHRSIPMQAACETHTGPRVLGAPVQSFDTDMFRIQGQITGDPDFDLLRITAGTGFGLPSPGHTTLRLEPSGTDWQVDSFFDITYRIDFVGAPGGPLGGLSGSTTGTIRMQTGTPSTSSVPGTGDLTAATVKLVNSPNPFSPGTTVQYRLPSSAIVHLTVHDATGRLIRELTNDRLPAGPHAVLWDGRNDSGQRLGAGTYFLRLVVDGALVGTREAVLVK